jgi:GntR family transcriptional regulator
MHEPMYRQIAEDLRQKIESGELARGTQVPTELELREQYDASRNTVRDAVKLLVTRGLVETRPGQGTFVVQKIDPFITTLMDDAPLPPERDAAREGEWTAYAPEVSAWGRSAIDSVPRVEIQAAGGVVAAKLQVSVGAQVVCRHQQRKIDGVPWSLQTTFYPMRLVDQGAVKLIQAEDMRNGAVRYLEQALGIKQAGWHDLITARAPNAEEAKFFSLPEDGHIAIFEIFRTGYDEQGCPLRLTVTVYPVDRNMFTLTVGQVPPAAALADTVHGDDTSQRETAPVQGGNS